MVQIEILYGKKSGTLSNNTKKEILEEVIEELIRKNKVFKKKKIQILFIPVEIFKNPEYLNIKIAISIKENLTTQYYEALIKKVRIGIKKSRFSNLIEKGTSIGFELRDGRDTIWC